VPLAVVYEYGRASKGETSGLGRCCRKSLFAWLNTNFPSRKAIPQMCRDLIARVLDRQRMAAPILFRHTLDSPLCVSELSCGAAVSGERTQIQALRVEDRDRILKELEQ
jgi:hypothetical protein